MRFLTLTFCFALSIFANAQTFSWNKDQASQQEPEETADVTQKGFANIYPDYYEDSPTALGEVFHHNLMTAGHQKLPLGTIVKVTRLDNGLSTTVRINDRGAYCDDCVIDLSQLAAKQIDLFENGRTQVALTVLGDNYMNPSPTTKPLAYNTELHLTARGGNLPAGYKAKEQVAEYKVPNKVNCRPATIAQQSDLQIKGTLSFSAAEVAIIEFPISPFLVQLGSYSKYVNAERHILALQNKGFDNVFLLKEQLPGNIPLNRVIIAPFTSLAEAERYVDDLQRIHEMKALVFQTTLMEPVGK